MKARQVVNKLHLYLGLASGVIVFILGVTGCLWVFHAPITHALRHDLRQADVVKSQTLPVGVLEQRLATAMGVERLRYGLATFRDRSRNWQAFTYRAAEDTWTYFGDIKDYRTGYINPYTGKVEGIVDEEHDFFQIVKGIHWSLLLATPIGQPVVAWATLVFLVSMLSGLVLWLPRRFSRQSWRRCFRIDLKLSWKRINHDIHNVLGFYALLVLLILGFSGLCWYFQSARQALYFMGSGSFELPRVTATHVPAPARTDAASAASGPSRAYATAWSRFPDAEAILFYMPAPGEHLIKAVVQPIEDRYDHPDVLWFAVDSGQLVKHKLYRDLDGGSRLLAMYYDIHVGAIGGLWTEILAFLASLVAASLPVTGFLYWYPNWKRKRRRKRQHKRESRAARLPLRSRP